MDDAQAKFDEAVAELTEVFVIADSRIFTDCFLGMGKSL